MKHALILALLLVAGCKMETSAQPIEAIVTLTPGGPEHSIRGDQKRAFATKEYALTVSVYRDDGVVRIDLDALKAASDRAAAHADSVTGLSISTTDSTTNKGR